MIKNVLKHLADQNTPPNKGYEYKNTHVLNKKGYISMRLSLRSMVLSLPSPSFLYTQ